MLGYQFDRMVLLRPGIKIKGNVSLSMSFIIFLSLIFTNYQLPHNFFLCGDHYTLREYFQLLGVRACVIVFLIVYSLS